MVHAGAIDSKGAESENERQRKRGRYADGQFCPEILVHERDLFAIRGYCVFKQTFEYWLNNNQKKRIMEAKYNNYIVGRA
ncbi:hypothetical protein PSDVSF_18550 [Pseudodesulfovibrio sediminis]|uniref:Uncharacterized protein n=1 Tax=Pseudodesulfovibrio sediminis TaxID=2810563 RepID=A0ABM7P6Q9_9BACT|nr:hypothetical protein PSDVSF_18550 [Pseudodesulfovibrio sediminis]